MVKTTNPTRGLFPITKVPKVSTTSPASAFDKIDLVVETFKASRNNVNNNNKEGKIENCKASFVFIETKITTKAKDILIKINMLNNHPGKGITNIMMIRITPNRTDKSLAFMFYSPHDLNFIFYSVNVG